MRLASAMKTTTIFILIQVVLTSAKYIPALLFDYENATVYGNNSSKNIADIISSYSYRQTYTISSSRQSLTFH